MIKLILFLAGFTAANILALLMFLSYWSDNYRFWPPGKKDSRWISYWILAGINGTSLVLLMVLNLLSGPEFTLQIVSGLIIGVIGTLINFAAIQKLGVDASSGLADELVETGVYSFSRNPQVLGNLIMLLGLFIMLPKLTILSLSLATGTWLVVMIFAEEKWLEGEYKEDYQKYRSDIPRFINISKIIQLLKRNKNKERKKRV